VCITNVLVKSLVMLSPMQQAVAVNFNSQASEAEAAVCTYVHGTLTLYTYVRVSRSIFGPEHVRTCQAFQYLDDRDSMNAT
jgi:hypothetical protein